MGWHKEVPCKTLYTYQEWEPDHSESVGMWEHLGEGHRWSSQWTTTVGETWLLLTIWCYHQQQSPSYLREEMVPFLYPVSFKYHSAYFCSIIEHFIGSPKGSCILEKNRLFSKNVNVKYIFVCAEVLKLLMKANNGFWQGFMCLNVWKCVGVGIIKNGFVLGFWLWDLICKFQTTFVAIADFLWEIYISIFIY